MVSYSQARYRTVCVNIQISVSIYIMFGMYRHGCVRRVEMLATPYHLEYRIPMKMTCPIEMTM